MNLTLTTASGDLIKLEGTAEEMLTVLKGLNLPFGQPAIQPWPYAWTTEPLAFEYRQDTTGPNIVTQLDYNPSAEDCIPVGAHFLCCSMLP